MKHVSAFHAVLAVTLLLSLSLPGTGHAGGGPGVRTYSNPLDVKGSEAVVDCSDPAMLRSRTPGETAWYAYCTSAPHNDAENNGTGTYPLHPMTILRSSDLTHWILVGDAFPAKPDWVAPDGVLWAPDPVAWPDGTYRLYYAASRTRAGGSAIGVATSRSPAGPWVDSGTPVVEPQGELVVLDPSIIRDDQGVYRLYYGGFKKGVAVRTLFADGLHSDPKTEVQVAAPLGPTGFGGPEVVRRGGYYYLFAVSSPCCAGPLTGNAVFVGRSTSPIGPFLDRAGRTLNAVWAGGTPVVANNGGRWVGPGMGSVFTDAAGRDWLLYHAIDRHDPYFHGQAQISKRHLILDRLDWVGGWPTVRSGQGPSEGPQPAPALKPGAPESARVVAPVVDRAGKAVPGLSDEFAASRLGPQWHWRRPPAPDGFSLTTGALQLTTVSGDLMDGTAPALLEAAPSGDYMVETRLHFSLPDGTGPNGVEAGLVVYGDDRNFVRLTVGALGTVRAAVFLKASTEDINRGASPLGYGLAGPAAPTTWLRIVKRAVGGEERYTAYTSTDGRTWERGGTWSHHLGPGAGIGLVALSGAGYPAQFDFLRVFKLAHQG